MTILSFRSKGRTAMAKGFNSRGRGGMPPMGGGMNANMMKQVQKMQQDMLRMQEELEAKSYTAAAGGGAEIGRASCRERV